MLLQETLPPLMFDNDALQVPVTSVEVGPVPLSLPQAKTPKSAIENMRTDPSANPGIEVQFDVREPTWPDGHLVDLASGHEGGRRIEHHRVGPWCERDQKMASCVALKACHDPLASPHLETGAEWRITRVIDLADGARRAAVSGSFKAGRL